MLSHKIPALFACACVLLFASVAQGQGPRPRTIQLDISTAPGGAAVTGGTQSANTGVFSLSFGNVNGLGLGTPTPGVTVTVQPGGALYTTPVRLTPRYTANNNNFTYQLSLSVMLDPAAGDAAGRVSVREGATANTLLALTPNAVNTFTTIAANNTAVTRYVGIFVSNANGATAVQGTLSVRLIYQVVAR